MIAAKLRYFVSHAGAVGTRKSEFSQRLEQDYLLPFARQQNLSDDDLFAFRESAVAQCQQMATLTL